ncbi:hypothetical protein TWF694_007639 [Orbilia ellipsospora]|uniref:F-box domain-containing protein n=1 Tax=Orbilia ellipsospora TaxID=2528407 RepID=A0AAV9XJA9_9PEZI
MAESTTDTPFSISDFYLTHPHILTTILWHCSPTTFDAFRYTCKSIYSMSLDPVLLEHHLQTILDRQQKILADQPPATYTYIYFGSAPTFDSKLDTLKNASGNLWRLRGLLLEEFLRMRSSWRIGDYKKTVVELNVVDPELKYRSGPHFDGTMEISFGTVRGDTFLLMWGNKQTTRLRTYQFTASNKMAVRKMIGPDKLHIEHIYTGPKVDNYYCSKYTTQGIGRFIPQMLLNIDDGQFDVSINEGGYKRNPSLDKEHGASHNHWYRWVGYQHDPKEPRLSLLRVKFHGRYQSEEPEQISEVDLAYEASWMEKNKWKAPAIGLSNAPNLILPEHSERNMKISLGRDGKCTGKGHAVGINDGWVGYTWKIIEPRRLEADISRMGVWKSIYVEFEKTEAVVAVTGNISKNLINPEPGKRFLLTNSKDKKPADWIDIRIKLVLPPSNGSQSHGKIVLACPAPAAYFRRLGMRDPEIPWADPGFKDSGWGVSVSRNARPAPNPTNGYTHLAAMLGRPNLDPPVPVPEDDRPEFIRTGVKLHQDVVDAEVVTRIVGWSDDGAVWVWDISEKDILNCAEGARPSGDLSKSPSGESEVAGKKLGYIKDVKGIAVTGDRLVERIFLFTYGEEQRVHIGGTLLDDGEDIDSGIANLRKNDLVNTTTTVGLKEEIPTSETETDAADNNPKVIVEDTEVEEEEVAEKRWRLITYSFGDQKGNTGGFYIDSAGDIEQRW